MPADNRNGTLFPDGADTTATAAPKLRARVSTPRTATISSNQAYKFSGRSSSYLARVVFDRTRTHSDLGTRQQDPGTAGRSARTEAVTQSDPHRTPTAAPERIASANTSRHPFVLSNFKYFLTLFSKFFSSFPHGTCSLSVSHMYLALDEIYHPLRAALPSNPTLRGRLERAGTPAKDGILTLSDAMFQWT